MLRGEYLLDFGSVLRKQHDLPGSNGDLWWHAWHLHRWFVWHWRQRLRRRGSDLLSERDLWRTLLYHHGPFVQRWQVRRVRRPRPAVLRWQQLRKRWLLRHEGVGGFPVVQAEAIAGAARFAAGAGRHGSFAAGA